MTPTPQETWSGETDSWLDNYADPTQNARRKREMRKKLHRIGIDRAPRRARVYDLMCGMGEALDTLYELGFRDLHGIDFTPYPPVVENPRFAFTQGDARSVPYPDASADWVINIHSLHHLQTAENVSAFLDECYRVLKPGGLLGIVDFPASPQIRLAFHCFRYNFWLVTPYLKWFGRLVQSEWHFLPGYLSDWPKTKRLLFDGKFGVVSCRNDLFYYHLTLRKPLDV